MNWLGDFLKKNVSTFLTIAEITGMATASFLFAKGGYNYSKNITEKSETKDKIKECVMDFGPAVGVATATAVCVISGNSYLNRTNIALAGAYAYVDQMYKSYKNKVIERYGMEAHNDIINDVMVEKVEDTHITYETLGCVDTTLDVDSRDEPIRTFYDSFSNRYFESKMSKVLQAEYNLNRNYVLRGECPLREYYEFLGLKYEPKEEELYWDAYKAEWPWIDFNHTLFRLDDGMEIVAIDMVMYPEEPSEELMSL